MLGALVVGFAAFTAIVIIMLLIFIAAAIGAGSDG